MDYKPPLKNGEFTTDVAPLPSAPPPTYEAACGASPLYQNDRPQEASCPPTRVNQSFENQPNPVQQIQITPAAFASNANRPYPVQQIQFTPAAFATTVNRQLPVGRHALKTTCTSCGIFISTRTRVKNRLTPTTWCIILFLTCICIPCSCCPYFCCDKPLRVEHFCPRCNAFLGSYVEP